jgi:hypothetical protein
MAFKTVVSSESLGPKVSGLLSVGDRTGESGRPISTGCNSVATGLSKACLAIPDIFESADGRRGGDFGIGLQDWSVFFGRIALDLGSGFKIAQEDQSSLSRIRWENSVGVVSSVHIS